MQILERYIGVQFLKYYGFALLVFVGMYVLVEFFERVDDFAEYNAAAWDVLRYFIYRLPLIFEQIGPVSLLVPTTITFTLLAKYNELTAMKACGVSLLRLSLPVLGLGLVISLLTLVAAEHLSPWSLKRFNEVYEGEIKGNAPVPSAEKSDIYIRTEDNVLWKIKSYNTARHLMHGVSFFVLGDGDQLLQRVDAAAAQLKGKGWVFYLGRERRFRDGALVHSREFSTAIFPVKIGLSDLSAAAVNVKEMTFRELYEYTQALREKGRASLEAEVDMHARISYPFAGLVMILFGIPFSLRPERSGRLALGVGVSIFVGFVFWVLFSLSVALGHGGKLPPLVSAWAANLLAGAVGLYLVLSVRQ